MATLRELRKFLGLSQREMSERTGLNIRLIQKYEYGECEPENMTAKNAEAFERAFGCTLTEARALDLNIFTSEVREALENGDLSLTDVLSMDKREKAMELSKIGRFSETFNENFNRIPNELFPKLSAQELANLVDAFYSCYSDGKRDK